jgi:hypothetical protein
VLALPLKNVDVSVRLPPGLQLAATPAGHLDCRMQLMGVHIDWPAAGKCCRKQDCIVQGPMSVRLQVVNPCCELSVL